VALISSISGTRGTIGGVPKENLTPLDIVSFVAAFAQFIIGKSSNQKIVIGRDGRISGEMVQALSVQTLIAMGMEVIDLGLSTTPTVAMAVSKENAGGGIIITASHNPMEWNALKLLNNQGEFISAQDGAAVIQLFEKGHIDFAPISQLGSYKKQTDAIAWHIEQVLNHPLVDRTLIAQQNYHLVVDCINSTGALSIPPLLDRLGCSYTLIHQEINGVFDHNPEPLPHHLTTLMDVVLKEKAHMGISVDPDVDRLALINEDGTPFGEEYTLVAIADYFLSEYGGGTVVSNLSSSRALRDIALQRGGAYQASAVGEVNVVQTMKLEKAIVGGEGNGGIIVPDLHYGRDALIGIALFLTWLAKNNCTPSALRAKYPSYVMLKDKVEIPENLDLLKLKNKLSHHFPKGEFNEIDGLKMDLEEAWIHLRKSNTEPIVRIYAEAKEEKMATDLVNLVKDLVIKD
jgi:phosphomannomutase